MTGHEQRIGDYRVICDASGFLCWASETVLQWNGLRVLRRFEDKRHPQDFRRGIGEDTSVPNPRPEPEASFLAAPVTQADL